MVSTVTLLKCAHISDANFKNVYFYNINFFYSNSRLLSPQDASADVSDVSALPYNQVFRNMLQFLILIRFDSTVIHQWKIDFLWSTSVDVVQPYLFSRVNWFNLVVKVTVA